MNKKDMQKLNRAAVAAVLAVSGAAISMPYAVVKADTPFKDLTASNSHYDAIMQLYNRDIISGYSDGTFRPSKHVTRGQAAKMLASILGLELSNVKNPKFKDVTVNNSYYAYIAALVELDVMSGYKDGTFRPNEVITRNQMAKIIVRGFQFGEAKKLTHTFEDVTLKNANRFYIQTLLDLNITQGTSAITYSPAKAVTRGQLASFLIRAEKANVHDASVKEVTNVEQVSGKTYVYLNGVKHTVHANLRDMLHIQNTEILMGAHIDATIVGKEIRALNKITFNASGAANNVLTFDGNDSTFRGVVEITGNHLRFANWNVTGEVHITPVQHEVFSNVISPLQVKTIAALKFASDNIDWGTITPPSVTQPDENDGLVDIPTDNKPSLPKLKTVEHDIQFVNVTIRALHITANRTKVRSNIDLAHVTVSGYVREFELHFDVGELYLQSDDNVTFYGVSDIEKLFKNTYKSVNLYADSITELLVVDNAYGWIDLGDYYYVDKVVIPPNKLPYEIFNDFLNDSDKIGNIEDTSGEEIDRDPIENTIVPDQEAPTLLIKDIKINLATANVTVRSNEDGTVHYVVKRENDGEPSIREIMQYTGSMGGNKAVSAGEDALISITDLQDEQSYIFYAVAVDEAGNISVKESEPFEVLDASPPNIEPTQIEGMPGGKRLKISMRPDEPGEYFYYYEELRASGIRQYSSEDILDFVARNDDRESGSDTVSEAGAMDFQIHNLKALTTYVVYIVMKDEHGNMMAEPKVLTGTTKELDDVYPYVIDGKLHPIKDDFYEFEIHVNEALDPESANNINNYELSGTAILNVDGQPTTIKPDKVTYIAGQKTIRIRIPSATALVNGDTIIAKILPGVTDLAENAFVNIKVVETIEEVKNTASYVHNDTLAPVLTIEKFQPNVQKTSGILTYRANKAGTYYYMIIPNSYDMKNMLPRDFYNEFTKEPTLPTPIPNIVKQGDNGANTVTVGSQSQSINLPTSTDPFESYSLYMVMKDRSGQLSQIQKVENVIDDSRAPFIRKLEVVPEDGFNDRISITVDASEGGRVYYKRFKKNTTDLDEIAEMKAIRETWQMTLGGNKGNHNAINDELAREYVAKIRSWSSQQLKDDEVTVFNDIVEEHTEYVYFFAVQDRVGNITMYPSRLSAPQTGVVEEYAASIMERSVYSDGINPTIIGKTLSIANEIDIYNILPPSGNTGIGDGKLNYAQGRTFTITFSERMTYNDSTTADTAPITYDPTTLSKFKEVIDAHLTGGSTVTDIEWEKDFTNLNSWNEHKLIFTVTSTPTAAITLDENDFALFTDLAVRRITDDETKLEYLPTTASLNGIVGIGLNRSDEFGYKPATGTLRAESRAVTMQLEINDIASRELRYYYVVQNDTEHSVPTTEQIVNYIKYQTSPNQAILDTKFDLGGFDKNRLGTGLFDGENTGGSFTQELILSGNNTFLTGQKLYFVTMDKYGNIVGSAISPNSTGLTGGLNHAKITE